MLRQMAQQARRQHCMSLPDIQLAHKRLHEVLKAATHLLGYFASRQADTLTLRHLNFLQASSARS